MQINNKKDKTEACKNLSDLYENELARIKNKKQFNKTDGTSSVSNGKDNLALLTIANIVVNNDDDIAD